MVLFWFVSLLWFSFVVASCCSVGFAFISKWPASGIPGTLTKKPKKSEITGRETIWEKIVQVPTTLATENHEVFSSDFYTLIPIRSIARVALLTYHGYRSGALGRASVDAAQHQTRGDVTWCTKKWFQVFPLWLRGRCLFFGVLIVSWWVVYNFEILLPSPKSPKKANTSPKTNTADTPKSFLKVQRPQKSQCIAFAAAAPRFFRSDWALKEAWELELLEAWRKKRREFGISSKLAKWKRSELSGGFL